jgi:signal peptidase I
MALYGGQRDVSLFRHVNRELMGNIISQECIYYKYKLGETKVNLYGEAAGAKYYYTGVILSCLVVRQPEAYPDDELGVQYDKLIDFRFLRDDLIERNLDFNKDFDQGDYFGADLVPQVGDIIYYYGGYYEVDDVIGNQYFAGKDPDYNYAINPINPGLENFGSDISIICKTHYTPVDKVQLEKGRING